VEIKAGLIENNTLKLSITKIMLGR